MRRAIDDGGRAVQAIGGRDLGRVLGAAALLLLVPLVAMLFTDEVAWGVLDFVVAGALLASTGLAYLVFARRITRPRSRLAIGLALATLLVLAWLELAVGLVGTPFAGS